MHYVAAAEGARDAQWTPSERHDVGTGSRALTWASLIVT